MVPGRGNTGSRPAQPDSVNNVFSASPGHRAASSSGNTLSNPGAQSSSSGKHPPSWLTVTPTGPLPPHTALVTERLWDLGRRPFSQALSGMAPRGAHVWDDTGMKHNAALCFMQSCQSLYVSEANLRVCDFGFNTFHYINIV